MSAGSNHGPKFQDLSREQAFGVEARVLQRTFPLLIPEQGSTRPPDGGDHAWPLELG